MADAATPAPALPLDADQVLKLAAQSMFDTFARTAMGTMVVDREHRIVWISEGYKNFLPALGFSRESDFVGKRVEEVVPNTLLGQVIDSGQPILVDLLSNHAGTFLVSRLPLRNGRRGDRRLRHGAARPPRDDDAAADAEIHPAAGRAGERAPPAGRAAPAQVHRCQLHRQQPGGTGGQAPGAPRGADRIQRAAAGRDRHRQGAAGACHPRRQRRAARPFVGVNIAAVPETLLEAEFFGVAPGAYTGAERKGRDGKFKVADGGTLFLDEIGDMPLALQSKLLRVLQEQEIEPLGSNRVERVDVRIVAATSRDLPAMVARGEFRADLYYRLSVLPIRVPPLRERLADLEALIEALAEDIARRSGLPHKGLTPEALDLLAAQPWAGNIRELRNVLEQATLMTDDPQLGPAHFAAALRLDPQALPAGAPAPRAAEPAPDAVNRAAAAPADALLRPLQQQVDETERAAIAAALRATGGNRVATAKLLGMSRAALYVRLERHPELADLGR
jgi:transcriptional regulator with PAS, ATPase and Fis domain